MNHIKSDQNYDVLSELRTHLDITPGINAFWEQRGGLYPEKWLLLDLQYVDEGSDVLDFLEELGVKWEFNHTAERNFIAIRISTSR